MGAKTGIRNFFCFLLGLIGFILSIFGLIGTVKGEGPAFIIMLIIGIILFTLGVILSKTKNPKTKKTILAFFAVIIVMAVIIGAVTPTNEEKMQRDAERAEAWKDKDNSIMADIMMRDYVKKQLKSPSTAKFAPASEKAGRFVNKQDGHVYFVKSYVDSQNSFGATTRTNYHGEIKQIADDKWQLISLEFED